MNIEIISKVIIPIIGAILVYILVPFFKSKTTKEERDTIYFYVKIAVMAAEQIYRERAQGKLKRQYVIEYIRQLGFDMTNSDLEVMIEAAVKELKIVENELRID